MRELLTLMESNSPNTDCLRVLLRWREPMMFAPSIPSFFDDFRFLLLLFLNSTFSVALFKLDLLVVMTLVGRAVLLGVVVASSSVSAEGKVVPDHFQHRLHYGEPPRREGRRRAGARDHLGRARGSRDWRTRGGAL
jgi:hypothetical protein